MSLLEKFEKDTILFNIMEFNLSDQSNEKLARLFKIEYIPTIIMMESANRPKALIEKIEGTSNNIRIQKAKKKEGKGVNNQLFENMRCQVKEY